jgi:hypothetical protein
LLGGTQQFASPLRAGDNPLLLDFLATKQKGRQLARPFEREFA